VTREFDMLHAVPPQKAPDFIRSSPLADAAGWIDVDPATLRHTRFGNIFGLGDAGNTTNAKTAAAARKQAPVVAHNVLAERGAARGEARYDGYGSCPLTVERGKIVLAEFTYGGKVAPTFPSWFIEGKRPRAWHGGSRSASCRRCTGAGCSRAANGSRIPNFRVAARHGLPVAKGGIVRAAHAIDQCHGNARSPAPCDRSRPASGCLDASAC
jgi:NADPH-dependent 2,4-dienoyl-CoA reductase/sulfur reductase-like enzyme